MSRKRFGPIIASAAAVALLSLTPLLGSPAAHASGGTIVLDSLTPVTGTAGVPIAATLKVHSTSGCISVQFITVAVRDSHNNNLDFPGGHSASICTTGYTYTSGTRTFTAGTYTEFGSTESNNVWTPLTPSSNLVISTSGSNSPSQPTWDSSGNRTTTLVDEFNGTSLNTSVWNPAWFEPQGYIGISGPMNAGAEQACENSANVAEGSGVLSLALTHVAVTCGGHNEPWSAGLVTTQRTFTQSGGSFESRINLACDASGNPYGWPAWWATSNGHGEIDMMERYSSMGAHIHYYVSGSEKSADWFASSQSAWCGWHTYGVSWNTSTQAVKFYWDDTLVWTSTLPDNTALFPVLDFTINSSSVVPPSGTAMQVDWVRVWIP